MSKCISTKDIEIVAKFLLTISAGLISGNVLELYSMLLGLPEVDGMKKIPLKYYIRMLKIFINYEDERTISLTNQTVITNALMVFYKLASSEI